MLTCESCKHFSLYGREEPCCFCDEEYSEWTPKKEEKMNYPKLEIFDIVELRDGELAVVLLESENPDERSLGLYSRNYAFVPRIASINDSYDDGLINRDSSELDVMRVLKYSKVSEDSRFSHEAYMRMVTDILIRRSLCWDDFKNFNMKDRLEPYGWTWVREECKEVTMADIEEKFGCKVKIIKEQPNGNDTTTSN